MMRWIINFSVSFCLWLSGILADENASIPVLPLEYRLNGKSTQHAFGQAREEALHSTVRLTRNGKLIAMGALVSSEGHVLTKASSCVGAREATLHNGKSYKLKIKKRNEELDLALYEIISDQKNFHSLTWHDGNRTEAISWVLSAFTELQEIRVGITSGKQRKIGREGGVMGVMLGQENTNGVRISEVIPQAAADKAGLQTGDFIQKIDGRRVKKRNQVVQVVGKNDPGDVVKIQVLRNTEEKVFTVTLGHRSVTFEMFNRNIQMSGPVSKRKDNFPNIIQHDLPLPKEAMGGPLFNLHGDCIGINIARVDRVTTYTLPSEIAFETVKSFLGDQ